MNLSNVHLSKVSAAVVPQSKLNLTRCEARRRHFIMTSDIFGNGQTNILGPCYLFGKTYKQLTVAPLKSLKSTHSGPNYCSTYWDGPYDLTSLQGFFILIHSLNRGFAASNPLRLKYAMIKLKPGLHMIATIAVIAEKKKSAIAAIIWNHSPAIAATTISAIVVAAIAGEWFSYDRWTIFSQWSQRS